MNSVTEKRYSVELSSQQLKLVYDALTDNIVEWRHEVRRRTKAGDELGRLPDNLAALIDAREELMELAKRVDRDVR